MNKDEYANEIAAERDVIRQLEIKLKRARARLQLLEDGAVVLVEFKPFGNPYAYRIPDEWCLPKIGDEVVTPPTYNTGREQVVTVVGYGRGGYDGPLRTLTGRVSR